MSTRDDRARLRRTAIGRVLAAASIAAALVLGILVLRRLDARPRTDDAVVTADTIEVVPEVTGRIVTLDVKDDQAVHQNDVLFTIDSEPYRLRLAQAKAQMHSLENQIALGSRTVASQVTGASVAQTNIDAARARLEAATDTLDRLEPLAGKGYVTAEQLELARTAKLTAEAGLKESIQAARQARQLVGNTLALESQLDGARALVAMAERDLRNTTVRAPFDGRIVGVKTSVGQIVSPVRPLFTLIDTRRWYVVANFRETELRKIRPGDPVTAYVMADPRRHLDGTVESIGSGVITADDLNLAGVPHVWSSLNWVRIAQRFPVRVLLAHPPAELMRLGASAVVVIHHDGR